MPSTKSPRQLTSIADAADSYDVSGKTLRRWIASGRLPAYRVGPKLIKVDLEDLAKLMQPVGGLA